MQLALKNCEQNFQISYNSNIEYIANIQEMKEGIDELRIKLREKINKPFNMKKSVSWADELTNSSKLQELQDEIEDLKE